MKNNALVVVSGLPGVGKTTLAKALAHALDARHFNTDTVRENLHLRGQYDPTTKAKVYQALSQNVCQSLSEGATTVIDGTFYLAALRKPYFDLSATLEIPIYWIELKADEATIRERVSRSRPHTDADFGVYQSIRDQYEPMDTPHLELSTDQHDIGQLLAQAQKYIES